MVNDIIPGASKKSLQQHLDDYPDTVTALRDIPLGRPWVETRLVSEYSDWREEQKSWREGAAFLHQSEHMSDLFVEGPDALRVFRDLSINAYKTFLPGQAKQFVATSPAGYIIGDGILVHLEENSFDLVGDPTLVLWVQYNIEIGDYDVTFTVDHANHWSVPLRARDVDPVFYRFEVQGPQALPVIEKATGKPVPEVKLFHLTEFEIAGHRVRAIRHGMAGQPGFEIFGPYAEGEAVRAAILEAGAEFGIVPVGSTAYFTANLESGWFVASPFAIYEDESLRGFREWLPVYASPAIYGSFDSKDIEDYYFSPYDIGYGGFITPGHDFVGSAALEAMSTEPRRVKVTLIWDEDDFAALYRDTLRPESGDAPQFRGLHDVSFTGSPFDAVQVDGETVGVAVQSAYVAPDRRFISLAAIDAEHAEPGTQVTVLWGDDPATPHRGIPPHRQVSVRATVAPTPFSDYARESYRK